MDPLILFKQDRERARSQQDPTANLCTVANMDAKQRLQIRTVVLRDIDELLGLFINSATGKWLAWQTECALQTYWPSTQIQYRIHAHTQVMPKTTVDQSWQLRPDIPKRLDWYYAQGHPQSSPVASREALIESLQSVEMPNPPSAPAHAQGLLLHPTEIERLDLSQDNGIHDRVRYQYVDQQWQKQVLVP